MSSDPPRVLEVPIRQWLLTGDLPAGYRAGTYLAIEKISALTGFPKTRSQRIIHFTALFFIFLSAFLFVGVSSLWSWVAASGIFYSVYLHDMNMIERITDFPEAAVLCFATGLCATLFLRAKLNLKSKAWLLLPLTTLAAFIRENGVLILVFTGFILAFDFYFSGGRLRDLKRFFIPAPKTVHPLVKLALFIGCGLVVGRIIIRLVFPETATLPWDPRFGIENGSIWNDSKFFFPKNIYGRRRIVLSFLNQYWPLALLSLGCVRFAKWKEVRVLSAAVLCTLLFYHAVYTCIAGMVSEQYAAMAIALFLYIPLGIALNQAWPIDLIGINDSETSVVDKRRA